MAASDAKLRGSRPVEMACTRIETSTSPSRPPPPTVGTVPTGIPRVRSAACPSEVHILISDTDDNNRQEGTGDDLCGAGGVAAHRDERVPLTGAAASPPWVRPVDVSRLALTEPEGRNAPRGLFKYYRDQRRLIDTFVGLDKFQRAGRFHTLEGAMAAPSAHGSGGGDDDGDAAMPMKVKLAVRGSVVVNVVLLGVKIAAFLQSSSLTVLASALDSALDLFSGVVLVITAYLSAKKDPMTYPIGKPSFEPLGVLIFSSAMFVAATQMIQESVAKIVDIGSLHLSIDAFTIGSLCGVVVAKVGLFIVCRRLASESTACEALAADHRNDIVSNTLGVATLFCAAHAWTYSDPVVALCVTLFIMTTWARSCYEQVMSLNGHTANGEYINAVTMLALNHHPSVVAVDTVRAVTAGTGYFVEVDIVLPPEMPLREAHDIGESLQLMLEKCPMMDVARAHVHLDWETSHDPKQHR